MKSSCRNPAFRRERRPVNFSMSSSSGAGGSGEARVSQRGELRRHVDHKQRGIMRQYQRLLQKEQRASGNDARRTHLISQSLRHNSDRMKMSALQQAELKFSRIADERREKRVQKLRQCEERKAALKAYKKKRTENYRKISQKTARGQPVMKGRIELLLGKIQREMDVDSVD